MQGLKEPLPKEWAVCQTPDGEPFYVNSTTEECSWDHPLDEKYRQIYLREKALLNETKSQAEQDRTLEIAAEKANAVVNAPYTRGRRHGVYHDAPLAAVQPPPPASPLVRGMRFPTQALPCDKPIERDLTPAAWRMAPQPAPWITECRPDTAPPALPIGGGQLAYALGTGNKKSVMRALRDAAKEPAHRATLAAALAGIEQDGWEIDSQVSESGSGKSQGAPSERSTSISGQAGEVEIPWFMAERKARSREIFGTTRLALAREQARGKLLQKKYARGEKAESDPNMDRFYWSHTKMPRESTPCHPGVEQNHGPLWFAGQPKKLDLDAVRRKYRGYLNKP